MKNQTFGIEIETTGIGRERTAKAIAAHFGTTAQYRGRHLDDWRVPMPDGRHWTVESDGSVTDPDAEVVSPVCRYEDIEMVQEVVRAIRAAGAKSDGSCGIHIHIGLGEHTPQSLRRLVNIVNAKEDLLTMALGITPERRARWCRPIEPGFLAELNRRKPTSMEAFARLWYARSGGSSSDWRRCAERHYDHQPLPPAQPPRDLLHRAACTHHRVPRLQRHTPRRRDKGVYPAVPRHQRTGADQQGRQPHAPGYR